jgi:16S rRNA (uracil1498-N3)-methyltransferase
MHRLFISSRHIIGDKAIVPDKDQTHHIRDVLRLRPGDEIILCDERGNEYKAIIGKISKESMEFKIKKRNKFIPGQKIKITLACAIPKKSKMDDIIDKLTQLGVDRIIPLKTERVIVKLDKKKEVLRLERWRKIALSSAKQSQRKQLPVIDSLKNIQEVLAEDFDLKLIPTLTGKQRTLRDAIAESSPKSILILIGPEGDFTPEELELAKNSGCIPVSLGDLVLRVETAAIAVVSYIRLYENR